MAVMKGIEMTESYNVRVRFISGETRIVLAKDFHWHEEGARSATAIVDGREVPIYKRQEPEWGSDWVEQAPLVEFGDEDEEPPDLVQEMYDRINHDILTHPGEQDEDETERSN